MNPDIPPDVFAAPAGASESAPPGDVRVFSPGQVALGTFIGTSIARGLLVAWNAHTVGRPVWPPILAGFLALGGLIGIAAVLPEDLPTAPFNLAMLLVAHAYASAQNRASSRTHRCAPRGWRSGWGCSASCRSSP